MYMYTYMCMYSYRYRYMYMCIYLFIYSFIHLFIYLIIYLFIYIYEGFLSFGGYPPNHPVLMNDYDSVTHLFDPKISQVIFAYPLHFDIARLVDDVHGMLKNSNGYGSKLGTPKLWMVNTKLD